jgi:hypothetical protein
VAEQLPEQLRYNWGIHMVFDFPDHEAHEMRWDAISRVVKGGSELLPSFVISSL